MDLFNRISGSVRIASRNGLVAGDLNGLSRLRSLSWNVSSNGFCAVGTSEWHYWSTVARVIMGNVGNWLKRRLLKFPTPHPFQWQQ